MSMSRSLISLMLCLHTATFFCDCTLFFIAVSFISDSYSSRLQLFSGWQTEKAKHSSWIVSLLFFCPVTSTEHCWMWARSAIAWQPKPATAISEPHLFARGRCRGLCGWCHRQTSTEGGKVTFGSGQRATYIMRGLYVSHNRSHMSALSLLQEAQARHCLAEPPTASCAAPEVHCVCRQGDPSSAGRKAKNYERKLALRWL